jgi:hypothetical protein
MNLQSSMVTRDKDTFMKTFSMRSQVIDEVRKTIKDDPDRINMVNKAV